MSSPPSKKTPNKGTCFVRLVSSLKEIVCLLRPFFWLELQPLMQRLFHRLQAVNGNPVLMTLKFLGNTTGLEAGIPALYPDGASPLFKLLKTTKATVYTVLCIHLSLECFNSSGLQSPLSSLRSDCCAFPLIAREPLVCFCNQPPTPCGLFINASTGCSLAASHFHASCLEVHGHYTVF